MLYIWSQIFKVISYFLYAEDKQEYGKSNSDVRYPRKTFVILVDQGKDDMNGKEQYDSLLYEIQK